MQNREKLGNTKKTYGFLWARTRSREVLPPHEWHFHAMQDVINEPIVRGLIGIDAGSGCGYDTYIMAKNNPGVKIVSIDLSDGVYKTKRISFELGNVMVIQCSIIRPPIKDGIFDFAYSFGVLHHTPDPKKSLLEIARILKEGCPAFVYLYENHSGNPVKYIAIRLISWLRIITVKMPLEVIYGLSLFFAPFVYIIFTVPSKILMKFRSTETFARKMPFNFGMGPFSLKGDLLDRFSAPIEYRFSRQGAFDLFIECGFDNVTVSRLRDRAGWIVWGYKRQKNGNQGYSHTF